jgi:hypothetical protein
MLCHPSCTLDALGSGITCVPHGGGCTMLPMVSSEVERDLLENVLDALDDLYDQRERAAWWTERLLVATAIALQGSHPSVSRTRFDQVFEAVPVRVPAHPFAVGFRHGAVAAAARRAQSVGRPRQRVGSERLALWLRPDRVMRPPRGSGSRRLVGRTTRDARAAGRQRLWRCPCCCGSVSAR